MLNADVRTCSSLSLRAHQLADDAEQAVVTLADVAVDQLVERCGRLDHLAP